MIMIVNYYDATTIEIYVYRVYDLVKWLPNTKSNLYFLDIEYYDNDGWHRN